MTVKVGSLFAGYGGIDLGLSQVIPGAQTVWFSEFDPAPSKILEHRWPDIPNLGDITKIDWSSVEPIDILTGGFPCQDVSHAGKQKGLRPDTRSGLWTQMAYAISQLKPKLVLIENVRGLLSASAHCDVESCPWCMGDPDGEPVLRALGAVLGDLADLGFDARWHGVRAAEAGAPHGRFRVFILAYPADTDLEGLEGWAAPAERAGEQFAGSRGVGSGPRPGTGVTELLPTPHANASTGAGTQGRDGGPNLQTAISLLPSPVARPSGSSPEAHLARKPGRTKVTDLAIVTEHLLPTPRATRGGSGTELMYDLGAERSDEARPQGEVLLPTPAVNDMGEGKTPEDWDAWTSKMQAKHGNGNGHGPSLAIEALRLLPTPKATNNENRQSEGYGGKRGNFHGLLQDPSMWGDYAGAIARWETILGRPAPAPTEGGRLSPVFVEWMMGLPEGHVTDPAIGLKRVQQLKALGNGVVPPQAALALRMLLS